jgi:hypothetical protein
MLPIIRAVEQARAGVSARAQSQVPWNVPPRAVRIKELDFPERPMAFFSLMDERTAWAVEIGC